MNNKILGKDMRNIIFFDDLDLYDKIVFMCNRKNITITKLAEEIGLTRQNLHTQAKNDRLLSKHVRKINEILGVNII
jgi:DNA-binding Xre family transcriptional regulator